MLSSLSDVSAFSAGSSAVVDCEVDGVASLLISGRQMHLPEVTATLFPRFCPFEFYWAGFLMSTLVGGDLKVKIC